MKNIFLGFILSTIVIAACKKDPVDPAISQIQSSIAGEWNVDTLTTYFYDTTGLLQTGVHVYPAGAPDFPYRFQFNNNNSWEESLHPPGDPAYIAAIGTYTITSDSTFTLIYTSAIAGKDIEPCKIISLTGTSFVFSKQLATVFNGNDPGYIKYVFQLTRL